MFRKIGDAFRNFMIGRYGQDQLGTAIFATGFVCMRVSIFIRSFFWTSLLSILSWVLLIWCICRMYSRNIEARSKENRVFTTFLSHLRDKEHRYYHCPQCRQSVRVPRGRGKICITCPKCRNKFIKKT